MSSDSTPEALRGIDKRVAVEMGYTRVGPNSDLWRKKMATMPGYATVSTLLPHFTTDPAAADLVKAHMRAQGWHYLSAWGTDGGRAYVDTRYPAYSIGEAYKEQTEEIALCLAFLAACEASKGQEEKNDE
jgi:hypothetical protein